MPAGSSAQADLKYGQRNVFRVIGWTDQLLYQ